LRPNRAITFKPFEPAPGVRHRLLSQRRTKVLSSVAQRFIEYARSTLPPSDDMSQTL